MKRLSFAGVAAAILLSFGVIICASVSAQQPGQDAPKTSTIAVGKGCCSADSCAKGGCCSGDSCAKKAGEKPAGAMASMTGMTAKAGEGDQAGCCACCGGDSCAMGKGKESDHTAMAAMPGMAKAAAGDKASGCCACCGADSCALDKDGKAGEKGEGMSCCAGEGSCCAAKPAEEPKGN